MYEEVPILDVPLDFCSLGTIVADSHLYDHGGRQTLQHVSFEGCFDIKLKASDQRNLSVKKSVGIIIDQNQ